MLAPFFSLFLMHVQNSLTHIMSNPTKYDGSMNGSLEANKVIELMEKGVQIFSQKVTANEVLQNLTEHFGKIFSSAKAILDDKSVRSLCHFFMALPCPH